jgi:hypothetical protein
MAARLAIMQLHSNCVEALASPVVDLDQVATNVGQRHTAERDEDP